nr:hypothetical protein [uncultured Sphingomonas sp.]
MLALSAAMISIPASAGPSERDADLGRHVLRQFVSCAVADRPDLAHQLVVTTPAEQLPMDQLVKIMDPRCFGFWRVHMTASDLAIRATFAEELIRRSTRTWPRLNPAATPPLAWLVPATFRSGPGVTLTPQVTELMRAKFVSEAAVGKLGECVVRASPEGVVAALSTKAESKAEMAALKALTPQLVRCMANRANAKFSRPSLRYALALSSYRMLAAEGALTSTILSSKQGR